ncbi:unnamed protein product [Closterium sp. NIES-64]|nr:unnamed protein product [Closterium sp. NIES-64]
MNDSGQPRHRHGTARCAFDEMREMQPFMRQHLSSSLRTFPLRPPEGKCILHSTALTRTRAFLLIPPIPVILSPPYPSLSPLSFSLPLVLLSPPCLPLSPLSSLPPVLSPPCPSLSPLSFSLPPVLLSPPCPPLTPLSPSSRPVHSPGVDPMSLRISNIPSHPSSYLLISLSPLLPIPSFGSPFSVPTLFPSPNNSHPPPISSHPSPPSFLSPSHPHSPLSISSLPSPPSLRKIPLSSPHFPPPTPHSHPSFHSFPPLLPHFPVRVAAARFACVRQPPFCLLRLQARVTANCAFDDAHKMCTFMSRVTAAWVTEAEAWRGKAVSCSLQEAVFRKRDLYIITKRSKALLREGVGGSKVEIREAERQEGSEGSKAERQEGSEGSKAERQEGSEGSKAERQEGSEGSKAERQEGSEGSKAERQEGSEGDMGEDKREQGRRQREGRG